MADHAKRPLLIGFGTYLLGLIETAPKTARYCRGREREETFFFIVSSASGFPRNQFHHHYYYTYIQMQRERVDLLMCCSCTLNERHHVKTIVQLDCIKNVFACWYCRRRRRFLGGALKSFRFSLGNNQLKWWQTIVRSCCWCCSL